MSEQKILSIDGTILNTSQGCARKTKYNFVDNLRPPDKEEALERGDLIHKMMEVYYSLQLRSFNFDTEVWRAILESGMKPPQDKKHETNRDFCLDVGRFFATKMTLPSEEVEESLFQQKEYCNYYEHDSWAPLAVEEVGSKILYENENYKFIYNFKIDLVAEKGRIIAPFDHKTSKRREEPSSLSNQFIGYCYGLGLNNLVVNKIGFQKTLTPQQRFNRYILTIDNDRTEEWKRNTILSCIRLLKESCTNKEEFMNLSELEYQFRMEEWSMNFTHCDKYSGCVYAPLCETDPESRLYKIDRDFKVEKPWDVAKVLEEK